MNQKAFLLIILMTILFIYNTHVYPFEKEISGNFFEMETRLKLSKEQSEKLLKIREKYFSDMQRLRYEIFKKNIELKNLYFDAAADESTILNKQKELMDLRQKLEE
ncbi:MAG: hypothetical protein N2596_00675, partial [Syntrophorhabdaceae bacterium]|nr:hypothetical protein [Syntrophorhabdaceae bacterium]